MSEPGSLLNSQQWLLLSVLPSSCGASPLTVLSLGVKGVAEWLSLQLLVSDSCMNL